MPQKNYTASREGYLYENYRYFHLHDTAGQERSFHYHDFDKIVILKSGHVDYTVEDVTYALSPWSVLLVKNHAIHRAVIDVSVPYDRIIIYLNHDHFMNLMPGSNMMACFESTGGSETCLLLPDERGVAELSSAVDDFEALQNDGRFGADTIRETMIIRILIYISRFSSESAGGELPETSGYDRRISSVISYINANLSSDLSVESLANSVYLSRYTASSDVILPLWSKSANASTV